MFSDVLRDLFHSGLGVIRVAAERFFGVPRVTALPTAGIDYRGTLTRLEGGAGVADRAVICEKNTSDAYAWNDLGRAALDDRYVNVSGDTMTGALTITSGGLQTDDGDVRLRDATDLRVLLEELDATADSGKWLIRAVSNQLLIYPVDDTAASPGTQSDYIRFTRSGATATAIVINEGGNNIDVRMETDTISNAFELDAGTDTVNVIDSAFRIRDNADNSKQAQFQASNITTATTRQFFLPNQSGGLAVTDSNDGVRVITASATFDPPDTANLAFVSTTITVTGAAVGDTVICGHTTLTGAWLPGALVESADTVRCRFQNISGGNTNAASGTLRATVFKAL